MQKNTKRLFAGILVMSLVISLMSASTDVDAAKKKVVLSKKSVTITKGKSQKIKIRNIVAKKIKKITVKSANKRIAKVNKIGAKKTVFKVTGKSVGNTKIKVVLKIKGQTKAKKFTLKVKVKKNNTGDGSSETTPLPTNPNVSILPKETATPTVTSTVSPNVTVTPIATTEPMVTPTVTPNTTATPIATAEPVITPTMPPNATATPIATTEPVVTPTVTPNTTATPDSESGDLTNVQIENLMVTGNRSMLIIFDEPCTLTTDDIVIKTKSTSDGSYGEPLVIESMEKDDPFQYEVVLDTTSGNYIVNNGYVEVTVSNGSETPLVAEEQFECETVTTTRQWTPMLTKGTTAYGEFLNLYNEDFVGTIQYETEGDLPDGMHMWQSGGYYLYLSGTPETTGKFSFTITITDEAGNRLVYKTTALVGDAENMYVSAAEQYVLAGEEEEAYIKASGGSGSYTYTKVEGDYDFTVDSTGTVEAKFSEAGTYKLYVDVADAENTNLTERVEVVYHVEAKCLVSGQVRSLGDENPYFRGGGFTVYVIPQDREIRSRYYLYKPQATLSNPNCVFDIYVPAGMYDIQFVGRNGSMYKVMKDVEVKDSYESVGIVELPVCEVNLEAPNDDNLYSIYWADEEGVKIGRDETFLVRPGTYTIHSIPESSLVMASLYDFTVTFTATDTTVYKEVQATPTGHNITEVTLDSNVDVTLENPTRKWYKFTPQETGTYRFYSTGLDESLSFYVYSDTQYDHSDYHYLTFSYTWQSCIGSQLDKSKTLTAGTTYYISVNLLWEDKQDDFTFGVEKVE